MPEISGVGFQIGRGRVSDRHMYSTVHRHIPKLFIFQRFKHPTTPTHYAASQLHLSAVSTAKLFSPTRHQLAVYSIPSSQASTPMPENT